jgi:lysophospholipase L1-like esterase
MTNILKLALIASLILNIIAVWALFHYVYYGGSPLSELKRKLLGSSKSAPPAIPYADENAAISKEVADGKTDPLRVVFFGASITHNWDLNKYFPKIHPVNRGVGGFVPDLMTKFKSNVLDLKPAAMVVKFCSINIRPQIPMHQLKDALEMMVQLARDNGIVPVVTTIIPPSKPAAHIGDFRVIDTLAAFNEWVRDYAARNSLAIIDYARAIQDENGFLPREYAVDPVHLNDKGYDIIAGAARPVIYKVMGID